MAQDEELIQNAQLYDAGQDKKVPRHVVLLFELTSVPRSLADVDGTKHNSRKVAHNKKTSVTYDDLALQFFRMIMKGTGDHACIQWVNDTYPDISINPLNTRLLCYCTVSETRLFYDVIVISCNQTRRSPGLVSE